MSIKDVEQFKKKKLWKDICSEWVSRGLDPQYLGVMEYWADVKGITPLEELLDIAHRALIQGIET